MTRIALVTGGGSGIGRCAALALAEDGWNVVVVGRREAPLQETCREAAGGRVLATPCDVADAQQVKAAFEQLRERFGRLDLLFNNAGVNVPATPVEQLAPDDWRRVIDVNLTGAFLCAQAAFRLMKDQSPQGGRIINNGSISAHVPRPHSAPYTAAKHGVTGLTRSLSLDGRAYDIACGQIDIGNASTDMTSRMAGGVLQANGETAEEPTFDAREVARAVLYMANLPLSTNVPFLTVMANRMPYMGRG